MSLLITLNIFHISPDMKNVKIHSLHCKTCIEASPLPPNKGQSNLLYWKANWSFIRGYPLSTYPKFSERLTFLAPWYAHALTKRMSQNTSPIWWKLLKKMRMRMFNHTKENRKNNITYTLYKKIKLLLQVTVFPSKVNPSGFARPVEWCHISKQKLLRSRLSKSNKRD